MASTLFRCVNRDCWLTARQSVRRALLHEPVLKAQPKQEWMGKHVDSSLSMSDGLGSGRGNGVESVLDVLGRGDGARPKFLDAK